MEKQQLIEAGRVANTHGVAGAVKIEVWLDSPDFMKHFGRLYIDRREVKMRPVGVQKNFLIAKLEGVEDVNAAMALKGKTVCINRADAKLPKGTFFLQDIIGAQVLNDEDGSLVGILTDVIETPASRIYVVKGAREHLIPAVPEFIMSTDPEAGMIRVKLIEGM